MDEDAARALVEKLRAQADHDRTTEPKAARVADAAADHLEAALRTAPPVEPREPSVPVSELRALIERHGCAGSGASLAVDLIWLLREAEQDTERETSDE